MALFLTGLIVVLFLPRNPTFKAVLIDQKKSPFEQVYLWDDLENDSVSDRICSYNNPIGTASVSVTLFTSKKTVEWDLRGQFIFSRDDYIFTGDYNRDGKKELYIFTQSDDSIYLNMISDFRNSRPAISNRFIAKAGMHEGKSDVEIIRGKMDDLNDDGFDELVFGITTGFSIYPRNIFAYDIRHGNLLTSPVSGFQIQRIVQQDVTGDGKNEILLSGYAPGNIHGKYPYSDSSCWLMVLDRKLNFLFAPIEFPGVHGILYPLDFHEKMRHAGFCFLRTPPADSLQFNHLIKFDFKGNQKRDQEIKEINPREDYIAAFSITTGGNCQIYLPRKNGEVFFYDTNFLLTRKMETELPFYDEFYYDVDGDGNQEIIVVPESQTYFGIYRSDLSHPVKIDIPLANPHKVRYSTILNKTNPHLLFINTGDMQYIISYYRNPYYYLKWLVYLGIYLGVLLFTLFVMRIQKTQIQKRFETERKITELQLKIVRNQMDPHFTMNAIDSVIDAINRQEKEEAKQNLLHFSKMYRSLVLTADKIKRTLEDEVDFTKNYLELEKFSMMGQFTFRIDISPEVNLQWEIPKMIIQSPVENAVKHGFSSFQENLQLVIRAFVNEKQLIIEIRDNGIGRESAKRMGTSGTGKGLKITEEFLSLYEKITGIKVTSGIMDLYTETNQPAGTCVTVNVPIS